MNTPLLPFFSIFQSNCKSKFSYSWSDVRSPCSRLLLASQYSSPFFAIQTEGTLPLLYRCHPFVELPSKSKVHPSFFSTSVNWLFFSPPLAQEKKMITAKLNIPNA